MTTYDPCLQLVFCPSPATSLPNYPRTKCRSFCTSSGIVCPKAAMSLEAVQVLSWTFWVSTHTGFTNIQASSSPMMKSSTSSARHLSTTRECPMRPQLIADDRSSLLCRDCFPTFATPLRMSVWPCSKPCKSSSPWIASLVHGSTIASSASFSKTSSLRSVSRFGQRPLPPGKRLSQRSTQLSLPLTSCLA